jgi:hypothetical protein
MRILLSRHAQRRARPAQSSITGRNDEIVVT